MPFLLVTSASHMPRAMALFKGQGLDPIPAPTDYRVREGEGGRQPDDFFPDVDALEKSKQAIHEYLGILWARLRGQIPL